MAYSVDKCVSFISSHSEYQPGGLPELQLSYEVLGVSFIDWETLDFVIGIEALYPLPTIYANIPHRYSDVVEVVGNYADKNIQYTWDFDTLNNIQEGSGPDPIYTYNIVGTYQPTSYQVTVIAYYGNAYGIAQFWNNVIFATTNPIDSDTDDDGLNDGDEFDPANIETDGIINTREFVTNPVISDTDMDNYYDKVEIRNQEINPLLPERLAVLLLVESPDDNNQYDPVQYPISCDITNIERDFLSESQNIQSIPNYFSEASGSDIRLITQIIYPPGFNRNELDKNNNGKPNCRDPDVDGDGSLNNDPNENDIDGDGILNVDDYDDDNDGWFESEQKESYYNNNRHSHTTGEYVEEIMTIIDPIYDFTLYQYGRPANNRMGFVYLLWNGQIEPGILGHGYLTCPQPCTWDGLKFGNGIEVGFYYDEQSDIKIQSDRAVVTHEIAHNLGAKDMYVLINKVRDYTGGAKWELMESGSLYASGKADGLSAVSRISMGFAPASRVINYDPALGQVGEFFIYANDLTTYSDQYVKIYDHHPRVESFDLDKTYYYLEVRRATSYSDIPNEAKNTPPGIVVLLWRINLFAGIPPNNFNPEDNIWRYRLMERNMQEPNSLKDDYLFDPLQKSEDNFLGNGDSGRVITVYVHDNQGNSIIPFFISVQWISEDSCYKVTVTPN